MKTVFLEEYKETKWKYLEFSLLNKTNIGYKPLLDFASCRSWMCDGLFVLKNKNWRGGKTREFSLEYNKGNIYIGVAFSNEQQKQQFISNIPNLREKEKQAKVSPCTVYATQYPLVLIVKGSKYWKDSCWKMMLYTFFIKTFAYKNPKDVDERYWKALSEGNEETLLSKVRMKASAEIFDNEVYRNQLYGIHDKEGFVSICTGRNPPMAKLLGVKEHK